MHEVRFGVILENAARLAGRSVNAVNGNGVPESWKALAGMSLREGIRRLAAEKFPMMQRIEFRRYRPTWISNVGWMRGQECFHGRDYYRLESDEATGDPGTDGSGWRKLLPSEVMAFISWCQPWEPLEIDRGSIDVDRFAYEADPKYNPLATPLKVVNMNELGVTLQAPAPTGVYIRFVPKYQSISFVDWNGTIGYSAGDVVYRPTTKDCYQAVADIPAPETESPNPAPETDADNWQAWRISDEFESYLTRLVAVDFLTEDQGKYQTSASADREFDHLCERFHEGNGESRVRTGRFR